MHCAFHIKSHKVCRKCSNGHGFYFLDANIIILINKCSNLVQNLRQKTMNIIFCNKCYPEILKKTSQNPHEQNLKMFFGQKKLKKTKKIH